MCIRDSLGGLWGDLVAIFGGSWAVSGRREAEKKQMPKSFKNLRQKSMILASLGLPGEPPGGLVG
eukprot:3104434-Pyramimonas_sp.AAC.1